MRKKGGRRVIVVVVVFLVRELPESNIIVKNYNNNKCKRTES
jgi:hypothetical protein